MDFDVPFLKKSHEEKGNLGASQVFDWCKTCGLIIGYEVGGSTGWN
jgi:hypothetical protein